MRRVAACTALALVCLSFTDQALAADPADSKVAVGGDLQVLIPVGDLSDGTGLMLGPLVRGGYRVIPQLELTGRIGYVFGLSKDQGLGASSSVGFLPIWAGARYFFQDQAAPAGAYAGGELGINVMTYHASFDGAESIPFAIPTSRTDARLGLNLGGGYVISRELPIDLRAQLSLLNLFTDESVGIGIGLSAGYSFFVL